MANIMERITADNKTTYTARIRIKGYRQQTATFSRITDARLWIQKTESLIREGKYLGQAEAKRHTFAEMTERYINTVLPNKSTNVGLQYAQQLRKWSSWLGELSLDKITTALIVEYRDKLALEKTNRGGTKSAATVNRYLAALSSAYSIAVKEWQWVDENPVLKIGKFKESKGRERFLSPGEIELLLKTCLECGKKDLHLAIVLSLSTGA
ncbi:MAG: site-specific integrase, partial [SAR324 cluster bacterium]|nr:site-specific integrase [SAR324 cluster bacterium]